MKTSIIKGRKIFLVDAIGAIVSVLSLLIPYTFEEWFGMPKSAVRMFIFIAIICSIYSTTIFLAKVKNWKPNLTLIALFNMSYCMFTVYHVFKNMNTITALGLVYFIGEILIILTLSIIELRLSRTTTNH